MEGSAVFTSRCKRRPDSIDLGRYTDQPSRMGTMSEDENETQNQEGFD